MNIIGLIGLLIELIKLILSLFGLLKSLRKDEPETKLREIVKAVNSGLKEYKATGTTDQLQAIKKKDSASGIGMANDLV
jgi:uncharacterized protein YjgD (DUF1641 family)